MLFCNVFISYFNVYYIELISGSGVRLAHDCGVNFMVWDTTAFFSVSSRLVTKLLLRFRAREVGFTHEHYRTSDSCIVTRAKCIWVKAFITGVPSFLLQQILDPMTGDGKFHDILRQQEEWTPVQILCMVWQSWWPACICQFSVQRKRYSGCSSSSDCATLSE